MNLSSSEAIEAMKAGKKVAHDLFTSNEWITSTPSGRTIEEENGKVHRAVNYWSERRQDYWQTDWRVVE